MARRPLAPSMPIAFFPVKAACHLLPDGFHGELMAAGINHCLRGQWLAGQLGPLDGKRILLHVTDTGTRIGFQVCAGRLTCFRPTDGEPCEVSIRGESLDFLRLALRVEDPDTLFFQRRLCLEGETESALYLKNLLDSLDFDWQAHVHDVLRGPAGDRLVALIRASGFDVLVSGGLTRLGRHLETAW